MLHSAHSHFHLPLFSPMGCHIQMNDRWQRQWQERGETTRKHFAYWRLNGLIFLYLSQQTKDALSGPSVKNNPRFIFLANKELPQYLPKILRQHFQF